MDKLKFAEWGERLKTGGAQMGRIVSGKMKEILASPTPESKMVDDATSETMEEPNWGMNLRICGMINSEEFSGSEVVKAIKKKISSKSGVSQRLSLDLLEACTMNCEKVFSEVASEKLLDEMVKMIENPQTDDENRERALQLIRAWGQSEDLAYLPVFRQTYMSLKERDTHIPNGNSNVHQQPSENYSVPDTEVDGAEHGTFAFNYGSLSVQQKKEFFEITRNSLEVLSSMLNIEEEPKPIQDDLTISMLEKCKHSQPVIQMIIESTTDDDILFEALHLHDELQRVISRCEELQAESKFGGQELEASSKSGGQLPENSGTAESNALSQVDTPNSSSMAESNDEKTERGEPQSSDGAHDASSKDETHGETETETETKRDEPENEEQQWKKH